ncbi:HTH domain-containing protein [Leifsonia sp. NPDC056665]|uniref:HTH domain-containing protein n=1 Tax=Leifsonia sp. NPDC056665 TaxID=3345901 RepID=UPI00367A45A3
MTTEAFNTAEEVRRLLDEGRISEEALQAITGITPEALRSFVSEDANGLTAEPQALSGDQGARLSVLAAQLTVGMRIDDDQRLTSIYESLTVECRLSRSSIAALTGIAIEDLERVLSDPQAVSFEKRYELAIKGAYLINAVNLARGN